MIRVKRAASELCCDEKSLLRALFEKTPDQALTAPAAIDIGGVEKIHARIRRCGEDVERELVIESAPVAAAELPAAESDFRNLRAGFSKRSFVHGAKEF